jgi:phosphoribosylanthranilate isomerase
VFFAASTGSEPSVTGAGRAVPGRGEVHRGRAFACAPEEIDDYPYRETRVCGSGDLGASDGDVMDRQVLAGGVKVCGVTSIEDARACVDLGVAALGLNFWAGTPRRVELEVARDVADELRDRVELVAVFVDADRAEIDRVREITGIRAVQLHGAESPDFVAALGPDAYKAVGVADARDVEAALAYPREKLLLDARVPGAMPGGTGHTFEWELAIEVARRRRLILAGGLHAGNVAEAVARVRPWRVDVASGVESAPGKKDLAKVAAFVRAATGA